MKLLLILLAGFLYIRGWIRDPHRRTNHLAAFLSGLLALVIALDSPLDTLDAFYLSAHMTQHLLLIMVAPALILLGHPLLPFLRAFPKPFAREAFGPFLTSPLLRCIGRGAVYPPVAWLLFAISTVLWHIPALYQFALHSPSWHGVQHACFFWTGILFWWPVVEPVGESESHWPRWAFIPYLLIADIVNTALSAFFVFSGALLYPDYALLSSVPAAQHDQTLAGLIMWVPGSLIYLVPAVVIAARLLTPARLPEAKPSKTKLQLIQIAGAPKSILVARRPLQLVMLVLALIVIVHGLTGPRLGALNLATILPWTYWRALSIGALLIVGNVFCMACPFTLARDVARRILPATRSWPRILRNKWIPVTLFAFYLWAYETFALWDRPFTTALIVVGYFAAAIAIDGTFRGASFCKYVCPIGQFHFVASTLSPTEIRIQDPEVCANCRTFDCIRGNTRQRGCELQLFQPEKRGNLDCTFCLDCVRACPHSNVTIADRRTSVSDLVGRRDVAVFALLFVFGALANAAGMTAPVIMLEHSLHARLGADAMPLIILAFLSVIAGLPIALATRLREWRRYAFPLVPVGASLWAAHLLFHVVTVSTGGTPAWLTPAQLLVIDAGAIAALFSIWQVSRRLTLAAPWLITACLIYGAGAWTLLQPMQMRGMR